MFFEGLNCRRSSETLISFVENNEHKEKRMRGKTEVALKSWISSGSEISHELAHIFLEECWERVYTGSLVYVFNCMTSTLYNP